MDLPGSGDEADFELQKYLKEDMAAREQLQMKKRTSSKSTAKNPATAPKMTKKQKLAMQSEAKVKGQQDLAKLAAGKGSRPIDEYSTLDIAFGEVSKSFGSLDRVVNKLAPPTPPSKSPGTIKKDSIMAQLEKLTKMKKETPELADLFTAKIQKLLDQV